MAFRRSLPTGACGFTAFFRILLLVSALLFTASPLVRAHQIDAVEFEFLVDENEWRFLGEMDIAFMLPEMRSIPGEAPLSRKATMAAAPEVLERLRTETEKTLRKILKLTFADKELPWTIGFPDFEKEPFELPEDAGDTALLSVRITAKAQPGPGALKVHWNDDQNSEFIAANEEAGGAVLTARSGSSVIMLTVDESENVEAANTNFGGWIVSGFQHVLPLGLDHLAFILGLFLLRPTWKPLAIQSLLFTIAHSLTLGLAVLGYVNVPSKPVEIFIAASIAWIGLENLLFRDPGKFRYIIVFLFGLVHGLGFASVLGEKLGGLSRSEFVLPLIGFNVGVELAQITVLGTAFLLLLGVRKWGWQAVGSGIVASFGLCWVMERVFFGA
jgi:hydrogenase/urease accessory protein HupE